MKARFVILAWHSIRVLENRYAANDLIAFGEDLATLDALGWTILPLADALDGLHAGTLPDKVAVLTADDGSILDFEPFDHPTCGLQSSLAERLAAFRDTRTSGSMHRPHVSAFAIASPAARDELDRTDYMGLNVWRDDWWAAANASGLISIENHSWDHNHGSLRQTVQRDNRRGDFRHIDTEPECRAEVDQASDYIEQCAGRRPEFFAYPYGQASDYLRHEYLPRYGRELGLRAALACDPEPVTVDSDIWHLPRYMFARDWKEPGDLARLLADVQRTG
jgi:peptidoglycan/xylan/chitin deacetylase (PgdA/CDA1 family)